MTTEIRNIINKLNREPKIEFRRMNDSITVKCSELSDYGALNYLQFRYCINFFLDAEVEKSYLEGDIYVVECNNPTLHEVRKYIDHFAAMYRASAMWEIEIDGIIMKWYQFRDLELDCRYTVGHISHSLLAKTANHKIRIGLDRRI